MNGMRTVLLCLGLLAPCLTSCIVVAAGAVAAAAYGAISYHENEAVMNAKQDLRTTFLASREAMNELNFPVDATQKEPGDGSTEVTLTGGDAKVVLERHPGEVTRIRARVGTFDTEDNRRRAGLLLEKIRERLN